MSTLISIGICLAVILFGILCVVAGFFFGIIWLMKTFFDPKNWKQMKKYKVRVDRLSAFIGEIIVEASDKTEAEDIVMEKIGNNEFDEFVWSNEEVLENEVTQVTRIGLE